MGMYLLPWAIIAGMVVFTLHYLPFINAELSMRLQTWLREDTKKMRDKLEELKRKHRN